MKSLKEYLEGEICMRTEFPLANELYQFSMCVDLLSQFMSENNIPHQSIKIKCFLPVNTNSTQVPFIIGHLPEQKIEGEYYASRMPIMKAIITNNEASREVHIAYGKPAYVNGKDYMSPMFFISYNDQWEEIEYLPLANAFDKYDSNENIPTKVLELFHHPSQPFCFNFESDYTEEIEWVETKDQKKDSKISAEEEITKEEFKQLARSLPKLKESKDYAKLLGACKKILQYYAKNAPKIENLITCHSNMGFCYKQLNQFEEAADPYLYAAYFDQKRIDTIFYKNPYLLKYRECMSSALNAQVALISREAETGSDKEVFSSSSPATSSSSMFSFNSSFPSSLSFNPSVLASFRSNLSFSSS